MKTLSEPVLLSFRHELRKISAVHPALGAGATLAAFGGLGMGAKGYLEARQRGEGVGSSLGSAAKSGLEGAAGGGLLGAGLGAVNPGGFGGMVSRFGQRQVHGLTGWTPKEGIRSIGGGAADAEKRLLDSAHAVSAAEGGKDLEKATKNLHGANKSFHAASEAERMGLTSVPGYLKSLHGDPLGTAKASLNEQFRGTTMGQKALMLGIPALGVAGAVRSQDSPDQEGLSKGQRVGKQVGELVGGVAGGAIPVVGQLALQSGLGHVGKTIGGVVDHFRRAPATNPTDPLLSAGQATATEHVLGRGSMGSEGGV